MTEEFKQKVIAEITEDDLNSGLQFMAETTSLESVKDLITGLNGSGEYFNFPKIENYKRAIKTIIKIEYPNEKIKYIARKTGISIRQIKTILK